MKLCNETLISKLALKFVFVVVVFFFFNLNCNNLRIINMQLRIFLSQKFEAVFESEMGKKRSPV